jgi:signal peptidase I
VRRRDIGTALTTLGLVIAVVVVSTSAVASPYEIPTGSMQPAIAVDDRFLANRLIYRLRDVERGDIVVFTAPRAAVERCGAEHDDVPFVKRVVGVAGDLVEVRRVVVAPGSPYPVLRPGGALAVLRSPGPPEVSTELTPGQETQAVFVNGRPYVVPGAATADYVSPDVEDPAVDIPPADLGPSGLPAAALVAVTPEDELPPAADIPAWAAAQRAWRVPAGALFVLGDNRSRSCDSHEWATREGERPGRLRAEPFVPVDGVIGQAEIVYWPPGNAGFLD